MVPDRVGPAGVLGAPAAAGREGFASCEYRAAPPRCLSGARRGGGRLLSVSWAALSLLRPRLS